MTTTDFPDWQHQGNVGQAQLVDFVAQTLTASQLKLFPPIYVGNGAAIAVELGATAASTFDVVFTVLHSFDSAGLVPFLSSTYAKLGGSVTYDVFTSWTPYVKFTIHNTDPSNTATVTLVASLLPAAAGGATLGGYGSGTGRVLARFPLGNVNAGASATQAPALRIPGPASLHVGATAAGVIATVQPTCGSYNGQDLEGISTTAASAHVTGGICVPNDDWSLIVTNTSAGNANCEATVMSLR